MPDDRTMVPLREYFEALHERDQRAIDLLAAHNADRIKTNIVIFSLLIAAGSLAVAIAALLKGH